MLKNVVLPAPLGPIRLTIAALRDGEVHRVDRHEPAEGLGDAARLQDLSRPRFAVWGLLRLAVLLRHGSTSGTAASSSSPPCSSSWRWRLGMMPSGLRSIISTRMTPKMKKLYLGMVHVARGRVPKRVADGVYPRVHLRQEVEVRRPGGRWRPGSRRRCCPCPPRITMDRIRMEMLNAKLDGKMFFMNARVERPGDPAEDRPEGVGPELGRHRVDAHRRGGGLVLANRDPRPPQPRVRSLTLTKTVIKTSTRIV